MAHSIAGLPGRPLGHYRIIRLLGQGGFADVYLGEHIHLNTLAAIKVLHTRLVEDTIENFRSEARTVARLVHPNIVRVLDFGVESTTPFLVMEYAPNGTLRHHHARGTQVPVEAIIPYVKQVAAALQYAHDQKIIHRDIKPENMLLGPHHEIMLSDFGIAVVAPTSSSQQKLQKVAGTIAYMAPEQLQGRPGKASDQYALAAVVYEWMCGKPPFIGSGVEIAMQHVTAVVPSLREKIPSLAPAVEHVVLKALAKKPGQRFKSVAAFAAALEEALGAEQKTIGGQLFSLRMISPDPPAQPIGRHQQRPLVGREKEQRRLHDLLLATEQCLSASDARSVPGSSRSAWLVVVGEGGIGKTRLAEEMGREAQQRGWVVALSRAYLQERTITYCVWIEALRQLLSQVREMEQEVSQHPRLYHPLTALLPELAAWLPMRTTLPPGSLEQGQLRLWEAMFALLTAASEHLPVLLILDDLQWIDESSSAFLGYVARRVSNHRLLLVGTLRQDELPSTDPLQVLLADLQRQQSVTLLPLQRLTDAQIGALVADVPLALIQQIQQQAAGNPFFAEELARSIGAQFIQADHLYRLPNSISALLDLRIRTLSSACQRLLAGAAVLGSSFELQTLHEMGEVPTAPDEDTILGLLEEALQTGMLNEEGSGSRITYHFWHPLLVSHLYDGLTAGRRASLHRRAADALIRLYSDRAQEQAAVISYHLINGGAEPASIAHYAELAGDRAYTLSAYTEAARHYLLVVEHTDTLPASASPVEHLRHSNLLERLGECTRVQGNNEEARGYFERALEAREIYRCTALQFDAQYEAQIDALLWIEVGKTWFDIGNFGQAEQSFDRAEQVLYDVNVGTGPVRARLGLERSYILWREGNFEEARETAHHTLNIFDDIMQEQGHTVADIHHSTATIRTLAGDPVDSGRTHLLLGNIASVVGQSANALEHFNIALAAFEQYDCQGEIALVCGNIGDVYLKRTEYAQAQAFLRRSLGIAESIGHASIMSVAVGNLGILSARLGDLIGAEMYYKRALQLAEQIHDPVYTSAWNAYLALSLQDQGKLDVGKKTLYRALAISRAIRSAPCIGFALVASGQFRIAQAIAHRGINHHSSEVIQQRVSIQLLQRARKSLLRALALDGLEAETRTEGQLALARASFLLGGFDDAQEQTLQVIEEARHYEQTWLLACAQRLMGSILFMRGEYEEADVCFTGALETLQKCGMRLEWARTLRSHGRSLLLRVDASETFCSEGLRCLQEARQVFEECYAPLDLEQVDSMLSS